MSRIKRYITALRRYNRSRGFGIHSPFAFCFVRKVLREKCPYYAYQDIRALRDRAKTLAAQHNSSRDIIPLGNAKMLFRIACYFSPSEILQIGTTHGVSSMTMLRVSEQSRLTIYTGDNTHSVIFNEITSPCSSRISRCKTLQSAVDCYNKHVSDNAFLLINNIDSGENSDLAEKAAIQIIENGGVVIIRNLSRLNSMRHLWNRIGAHVNHGMSFTNYHIGIFVGLKHLPRQNYTLWF